MLSYKFSNQIAPMHIFNLYYKKCQKATYLLMSNIDQKRHILYYDDVSSYHTNSIAPYNIKVV